MSKKSAARSDSKKVLKLKVFDSLKADNRVLELLLNPQRTAAFVRIATSAENAAPSAEEVKNFLQDHGVNLADYAEARIAQVVEAANAEGSFGPVAVAEGKAPVNGEDGRIEWFVRRPTASRPQVKKGARVDHKERDLIVNISKGQKILTVRDATPGTPGRDVFGEELPCQPGQPAEVKRGKNVDFMPDGKTLASTCAGYLDLSGNTVSVEPVLVVKGNVDLSVGNIDFIGPVKVNGDVLDGFHVKAGEGIEVSGMVEGAFLEAAKQITVVGGVAGKGKGRITCKGTLEVRYLNDVYVETGGDIKVHNSVVNSTVKSLGRVDVLSGGIRGASVVARDGLRSPEIGSELGVRTVIVVGMDYDLKDELVTLEREIGVLKQTIYKIEAALGPLVSNAELLSNLRPDKAEAASKLMAQRQKLNERQARLSASRDDVLTRMQVNEGVWVEVDKTIFPGVVMQIGTCRRTFEMEVMGPVKLCPDVENGSIRVRR